MYPRLNRNAPNRHKKLEFNFFRESIPALKFLLFIFIFLRLPIDHSRVPEHEVRGWFSPSFLMMCHLLIIKLS